MHNRSESWVISEILHERLQQLQKLNKHKHILGPKHSYFLQKKGVAKLTAVSNILFKLPFTPTATLSTTSACFESSRVTSDEFEKHQSVSEWSIIIGLVSDKKNAQRKLLPWSVTRWCKANYYYYYYRCCKGVTLASWLWWTTTAGLPPLSPKITLKLLVSFPQWRSRLSFLSLNMFFVIFL